MYELEDGTFGVEVAIPDELPAKITNFSTEAAADQWIADHKATVERQRISRLGFVSSKRSKLWGE